MIRKILKNIFGDLGALQYRLVGWGLRRQSDLFVALVWRLAMQQNGAFHSRRWGRKKLVVLERQGGREDVENAYYRNPAGYSVLFLPRLVVKASARFFLGERLDDINYQAQTVGLEEAKEAYRNHLTKVLKWFRRLFGLSAILQFNVIYYAEQELARACTQADVRFVCLQKEAMWSPFEREYLGQFFKELIGSFHGDAIAFYNATSRSCFESAGLVPKGRGYVVGCARLDEAHRLRGERKLPSQGCVVYYLITEMAGVFQVPPSERYGKNWLTMASRVNRAIFELAVENPETTFIVKARSGSKEEQLSSFLSSAATLKLPANVELEGGGVGHKLLRRASVVVGFNSTAVLEAIGAGIPTVVPHIFSEEEKKYRGAHLVREGVQIAGTEDLLKKYIVRALGAQSALTDLSLGQKLVLERLVGNTDGQSGKRLRSFLDQAVAGTFVPNYQ